MGTYTKKHLHYRELDTGGTWFEKYMIGLIEFQLQPVDNYKMHTNGKI